MAFKPCLTCLLMLTRSIEGLMILPPILTLFAICVELCGRYCGKYQLTEFYTKFIATG